MRKTNPAREALSRAVNKAIAAGSPVIVEQGYDKLRDRAVEELKPVAKRLLEQGWGHDGAMLILSDALFAVEEDEQ